MEGNQGVLLSFRLIVDWFGSALHTPDLQLRNPDPDGLAAAERTIGVVLPAPLRAAYQIADGQNTAATHPLFPYGYWWLPLEHLVSSWGGMLSSFRGDDAAEYGKDWWHPGLIPFAGNGAGDGLFVAADDRHDGTAGEVVHFVNDDPPFQRTARSHPNSWATNGHGFDQWLRSYANDLAAERYAVDDRVLVSISS